MSDLDQRFDKIEQQLQAISNSQSSGMYGNQFPLNNDEIDLRELWNVLWAGKWWIIGITLLFAVAGVFYALNLPKMYKSEGVYAPVQAQGAGNLASQYGGLAAIAGIDLGGGGDLSEQAVAVIRSKPFIYNLIEKYNLKNELLALAGWNVKLDVPIWDEEIYDVSGKKLTENFLLKYSEHERLYMAYKNFLSALTMDYDKKKGLINISIVWFSPSSASEWIKAIVFDVNQKFMNVDLVSSEKNVDFLQGKISETGLAEMKIKLFEMLEGEMRSMMLASAKEEYVLKTVVPPIVSVRPAPNGAAVMFLAIAFLGGVLSVCGIFIRNKLARK